MDIWKISGGKPERVEGQEAEAYRRMIESGEQKRGHLGTLDGDVRQELEGIRRYILGAKRGLVDYWTSDEYADSVSEEEVASRFGEALEALATDILEGRFP